MDQFASPPTIRVIANGLAAGETGLTPRMRATEVGTTPPLLSIAQVVPLPPSVTQHKSPRSCSGGEAERKGSDGARTPRGSREDVLGEEATEPRRHSKAPRLSGEEGERGADAATSGEWGSYEYYNGSDAAPRVMTKEEEDEADSDDDDDDEDDDDDGLQLLVQMRQSRTAAAGRKSGAGSLGSSPAPRAGSPSCATPPPAPLPAEPLEPGWDAAGSGRRRSFQAAKPPSATGAEPEAASAAAAATGEAGPATAANGAGATPGTPASAAASASAALGAAAAEEEGGWDDFYAHAKDSPKLRLGKHGRNLRQTIERQSAIDARLAQRQANHSSR